MAVLAVLLMIVLCVLLMPARPSYDWLSTQDGSGEDAGGTSASGSSRGAGGGSGGGAHTLQEWFDCSGRELGLKRILLTLLVLAGVGE